MKLVVVGGGEHARVVIDAARTRADLWEISGYVDLHRNSETESRFNLSYLGTDREGLALASSDDVRFVLGLAGLRAREARRKLATVYGEAGARWASVVHTDARVSSSARVEDGAFVNSGAIINTGAVVEPHAVINTGAVVEHDVVVGAFAQISPAAAIGGGSRVGRDAYVGLGARIRDHVEIGGGAIIGMGAVVVQTVPANEQVVGHPAKPGETKQS